MPPRPSPTALRGGREARERRLGDRRGGVLVGDRPPALLPERTNPYLRLGEHLSGDSLHRRAVVQHLEHDRARLRRVTSASALKYVSSGSSMAVTAALPPGRPRRSQAPCCRGHWPSPGTAPDRRVQCSARESRWSPRGAPDRPAERAGHGGSASRRRTGVCPLSRAVAPVAGPRLHAQRRHSVHPLPGPTGPRLVGSSAVVTSVSERDQNG
jgi:hypothetical protein